MSEENVEEKSSVLHLPKDEYMRVKDIVKIDEKFISEYVSREIREELSKTNYSYINKNSLLFSIINENTFLTIYEALPDHRISLVWLPILGSNRGDNFSEFYFSREKSADLLKGVVERYENKVDKVSLSIRAQINRHKNDILDIDLTKEVSRLKDLKVDLEILNEHIKDVISWDSKTRDLKYYEDVYKSLTRSEGATDAKIAILNKAFATNNVLFDIIDKISISSPPALKQAVVSGLQEIMVKLCNSIFIEDLLPEERKKIINPGRGTYYIEELPFPSGKWISNESRADLETKRSSIESILKKFINVKNTKALTTLCELLSLESLAWIMPSLKDTKELQEFVNYRIEGDVGPISYSKYLDEQRTKKYKNLKSIAR